MKQLYPYQSQVVDELVEHFVGKRGARHYLHMATGSGKTLTVMEFLARNYLPNEKRVLWVTHRWPLINQAATELIEQRPQYNPLKGRHSDYLAFFGSSNNRNTATLKDLGISAYRDYLYQTTPGILFTSWQTLYSSLTDRRTVAFKTLKDFSPDLIIIDEAHYGKNGQQESEVYDLLINSYWKTVPMLGLSATPKVRGKHGWSKKKLGNIYFSRLVEEGYLARPVVIEESIPADVKIRFNPRNCWIENEREIASDRTRNRAIVEYYCQKKATFGKTIMFAVNTEHADQLAKMLVRRGIAAVAIHSKTLEDPNELIKSFRRNEYKVAVAVDMMNEGIDVPDIKTVFLSRPVTSEILFAQMIGRGCRKLPGKDTFNVVDFYNLGEDKENRAHLVHYKDWYNSEEGDRYMRRPPTGPRIEPEDGHVSNFQPMMRTLSYDASSDPINHLILDGLKIDESQTFGLEFEFEADDVDIEDKRQWLTVARPILNHFRSVFGEELVAERPVYEDPKQISHKKWNVVFDGSCGFEIVSPVLRGKAGFETVVRALRSLRASGLLEKHKIKLSTKSGTHVHLGWRYNDPAKVREILFFMRRFEGAFHSLIASSRVFRSNGRPHPYCRSVRASFGKWRVNSIRTSSDVRRIFGNFERRYCALNLTNFDRPRSTLEIRSHHGTLNEGKICLWLALWMNVHNALARIKMNGLHDSEAGRNAHLPSLTADSDIVTVAQTHLDITVESNLAMLKRLHERRIEITGNQWWGNELGEQGIVEIHGAWKDRLPLSVLTSETPVLPEDIFIINELPKEMRLQTAKILIDSNRLQYADPSLLAERFNSGMLFVRLKAGAVIATAGVKGRSETVHRLSEDLRQAGFRSLGSEFRLLELKSAAQNSRVIERGWDFGELRGSQVPGIMGMADWLARKSIKEAVPVAFVTDEDSGGLENYQAAGWKMVGQITSPFTSNRLSVLLPL